MKAASLKPYGNWVLVRVDDRQTKIGRIHLPGDPTGSEAIGSRTGHVVATGPGRIEVRPFGDKPTVNLTGIRDVLSPGDRVIFRDYIRDANPLPQIEDDGEFALLHFMDLMATCSGDAEIGEWSAITAAARGESKTGWKQTTEEAT